jgi:hypothetical protein
MGGSFTLGYRLIIDYLRQGSDMNADRPFFLDHTIAMTLLLSGAGYLGSGTVRAVATGAVLSVFIVSPMSYYLHKNGRLN